MADKLGTITVDVKGLEVFAATVEALEAAKAFIDSVDKDWNCCVGPTFGEYQDALKELERIAAESETDGE